MSDTAIDALRWKSLKAMTHGTKPHENHLRRRLVSPTLGIGEQMSPIRVSNRLIYARPKRRGRGRSWLIAATRAWTVADQLANECRASPDGGQKSTQRELL